MKKHDFLPIGVHKKNWTLKWTFFAKIFKFFNFGRMSSAAPSAPAGFRLRVLVVGFLSMFPWGLTGIATYKGPRRKNRAKTLGPIYLVYTDEVKRKNATFQVRPKRCFQGIFLLRWFDGAF